MDILVFEPTLVFTEGGLLNCVYIYLISWSAPHLIIQNLIVGFVHVIHLVTNDDHIIYLNIISIVVDALVNFVLNNYSPMFPIYVKLSTLMILMFVLFDLFRQHLHQ
jgi:hypothetical protein